MAFATKVTIGTGNKITQSYQSQDVSVSVSYDLERTDTDLIAFMAEKAAEVEACHTAVWQGIYGIRAERASAAGDTGGAAVTEAASQGPPYQQTKRTRRSKELEPPAAEQPQAVSKAPAQAGEPNVPAPDAAHPTVVPAESPQAIGETGIAAETPRADASRVDAPSTDADLRVFEPATNLQKIVLRSLWTRSGHTPAEMNQLVKNLYGKSTLDDLTKPEAAELTLTLQKGETGQPQVAAA